MLKKHIPKKIIIFVKNKVNIKKNFKYEKLFSIKNFKKIFNKHIF
jgi:hypothetical protein